MLYGNLELGQEGREACPDQFTQAATLICPRSKRLILQVSSAAPVYVQCGFMPQGIGGEGAVIWQEEEPFVAGAMASLARQFDAVRVRNWKAGAKAEVFVSVA